MPHFSFWCGIPCAATAVYSHTPSAMSPVLPSESPGVSSRSNTGGAPGARLRHSWSAPWATMKSRAGVGSPWEQTRWPGDKRSSDTMSAREGMNRRCTKRSSLT
eukprot:scaffold3354_cov59-Isochrysis_galbana.AAC.1